MWPEFSISVREDVDDERGGVGGDDADGGVDAVFVVILMPVAFVFLGGGGGIVDRHDGRDGAEDLARRLSKCMREGERGWKGGNRKW